MHINQYCDVPARQDEDDSGGQVNVPEREPLAD